MTDDFTAQARALAAGIEQADGAIAAKKGELQVLEADRLAMAKRLGQIERFCDVEDIQLPYSDKKGM